MEKFCKFFEGKCYDLERTKDLYLSARDAFLHQADDIRNGSTFFMDSVAQKAAEMNRTFAVYSEEYRTTKQFAIQLDDTFSEKTNGESFADIFDRICGEFTTTRLDDFKKYFQNEKENQAEGTEEELDR